MENETGTVQEAIRVFVADDHTLVRVGLKTFLDRSDKFVCVGEAVDGAEAAKGCQQLKLDVALIDLFMPGMGGIETTRVIRSECPATRVVILTSSESCQYILKAMRTGASNYVLKDVSLPVLAEVIEAAYMDRFLLTQETTQTLIAAIQQESSQPDCHLTRREREVLKFMIEGHQNKQIACQLNLSVSTIKYHVSHILRKLDATSRSEAVARTLHMNLL
jgi:DNA-binding NarL/FixJ family response regulator